MSSDSEDDFYDNVTERLQKEKDKFQFQKEEKIETEDSLFDDSGALDEIVKNNRLPQKRKRKTTSKEPEETAGSSVSDLPDVSVDNAAKSPPKRMTRSRAKSSKTAVSTGVELPPARAKRQKSTPAAPAVAEEGPEEPGPSTGRGRARGRDKGATPRGRGATPRGRRRGTPRGRGRRGRFIWARPDRIASILEAMMVGIGPMFQRNFDDDDNDDHVPTWDSSIPTYSVGNTMEYPDQSYQQQLFSSSNKQKTEEVVTIEEDNQDEENEELSVKVYWQSSEFFKFTIRKFQKLTQIFEYFSKKENVTHDKLLFMYNEKILKPDDTPDSIDYSIVKFIDGGVVTQAVTDLLKKNEIIKDGIKIKFQCQNVKKPFEITVRPDDKLSVAMMQCSEHLVKPLDKLRFEFDGDSITGKTTARELEFEGGECIDVRILS